MEEKKLTVKEIYRQTIQFGWTRLWLYVRGAIVAAVVILVFGIADKFICTLFNFQGHYILSTIGIALGIFAFFFVAILPIEPMRAAHTAVMTEAILHNRVPQPCVEEGQKIALRSFPVMSFLILFGEGFRALADLVREKDASKRSDWGPKVRSMALFLLSTIVPYIGPCATSWAFCHQDKDTKDNLIEGAHLFISNLKHLIGFMIVNMIAIFVILMLICTALAHMLNGLVSSSPFLVNIGKDLLETNEAYMGYGLNPAEAALMWTISILVVYVIGVFIRPVCTIFTLQAYYASMDDSIKKELFKSDIKGES